MNITNMMKKDHEIKWTINARRSFRDIKLAIIEALVLVSPYFSKYFLIFSYASNHTIVGVLLHKNNQNVEQPIAFFSKVLRDGELKYDIMEKQAYALVKSLKHFRVYVLHSHIIAYVPSNVVKSILTQPDLEGKRAKLIAVLLEYDIKINPIKLIKGQGLAKMMTNSNCESLQLNFLTNHSNHLDTGVQVMPGFSMSPWYSDIVYVLRKL